MTSPEKHHTYGVENTIKNESRLMDTINEKGGFQKYLSELNDFKGAFKEKVTTCICCDGRIDAHQDVGEPAVRLPGVFVFEANKSLHAQRLHRAGITKIYSHEDCGAGKAAYLSMHADNPDPSHEELRAFAIEKTKMFCDEYGFEYAGHIENDALNEVHTEQVLYFDATTPGTPSFEQSELKGKIPQGFALSAELSGDWRRDVEALLGIAFSGHGIGVELVKSGKKFTVVVIAETESILESKKKDVDEMLKSSEIIIDVDGTQHTLEDVVVIDGFVRPS